MTKSRISLSGFIKVGQPDHIDQLQKEGLIYCNTIKYFRHTEHSDKERHDNREGATSSIDAKNFKIFLPGSETPLPITITTANLNTFDDKIDLTHLFCLFMINPDHQTGKPFVDSRNLGFGQKALLINRPIEFVDRVKQALGEIEYYCGSVDYYDERVDHHRLTVFHKPDRFSHQSEFRFHIKAPCSGPFKFRIGSIEDISKVLEIAWLPQLTLQRAQE
jgi:hypothetical protein